MSLVLNLGSTRLGSSQRLAATIAAVLALFVFGGGRSWGQMFEDVSEQSGFQRDQVAASWASA